MNAKKPVRKAKIVQLNEKWAPFPVFSIFDVFDYTCHTAFRCIDMHSELVNSFLEYYKYYNGFDDSKTVKSKEAIRQSVKKLFETTGLRDEAIDSQEALVEELYTVLR